MPPRKPDDAAAAASTADVSSPTTASLKAAPKAKAKAASKPTVDNDDDDSAAVPSAAPKAAPKKRKAPEPKEPKTKAAPTDSGDGETAAAPKEPKEPKEPKLYGPFTTSSIKSLCKTNDVQLNGNVTAILTAFVERAVDNVPTTHLLSTVASLLDVDSPAGVTGGNGVCCNRSYFNKHFVGCKLTKDQRDTIVCNVEIALTSIVTTAIDVTRALGKKNVQDILVDSLAIGWLLLFGAATRADTLIPNEVLEQKAVVKARRSDSKKPTADTATATAKTADADADPDAKGYSEDDACNTATA